MIDFIYDIKCDSCGKHIKTLESSSTDFLNYETAGDLTNNHTVFFRTFFPEVEYRQLCDPCAIKFIETIPENERIPEKIFLKDDTSKINRYTISRNFGGFNDNPNYLVDFFNKNVDNAEIVSNNG